VPHRRGREEEEDQGGSGRGQHVNERHAHRERKEADAMQEQADIERCEEPGQPGAEEPAPGERQAGCGSAPRPATENIAMCSCASVPVAQNTSVIVMNTKARRKARSVSVSRSARASTLFT
jgi:hypothetical protein